MSSHAWMLFVLRLTWAHVSVSEVDRVMNNSECAVNKDDIWKQGLMLHQKDSACLSESRFSMLDSSFTAPPQLFGHCTSVMY